MKKILPLLLVLLLLIGTLAACTGTSESENMPTNYPSPTETSAELTPELEETLEPEEISSPSVPSVSEGVTTANVRVYYVADENFNQPSLSPHEPIDLGDADFYHEFIESEEIPQRIVFKTDTPVEDFRFLALKMTEDGSDFIVESTLYQLDELTPKEPFVVSWWVLSTAQIHRGISFVDEDGVTRYFAFHASGEDGALFFIEFEQA